ncbi:hypothetical protein F5B22DRAFT_649557 [Xylaria bambusicola]|uniref:uncharacterized protein n=1 Tax=Xylaria bambusicola TaxID=326684 RepID=UPI002008EA1F|nr:uncharacterized protein F5B22DRAFT_649557 [Xylaria bambusicola]KAI0508857.1 hypothetical protein F5B22DRAFT_649557 [Xylaria bambusicola]
MMWTTAAVMSLLAGYVYGAPSTIVVREVVGSSRVSLESRMEDAAYGMLERRQSNMTTGSVNMTQWDAETVAACTDTLSTLSAASNPSGMAVCYNLVQLDTNLGEFMADLRLFEVSAPTGNWEGIPLQQMSGGIRFSGATASEINGQKVSGRSMGNDDLPKRQNASPTLQRTYMIVGKINQDQMIPPMTMYGCPISLPLASFVLTNVAIRQKIEPLIMPIFTLTATDATGRTISANVSSNEAAFVNGIFSKEVVQSRFGQASLAQQKITQEMEAGSVPFVLPGVNILIFPIGLVVSGVWLLLGIGAYGYGTYERYNYRETYRRRKAMSGGKAYASRI